MFSIAIHAIESYAVIKPPMDWKVQTQLLPQRGGCRFSGFKNDKRSRMSIEGEGLR